MDKQRRLQFYFDAHISKAVARQLRQQGVNVLRCEDIGLGATDDLSQLAYAAHAGCVMVSHDADFVDLHFQWRAANIPHAGIICVEPNFQGPSGVETIITELLNYAEMVGQAVGTVEADIENQLFYIP